MTQMQSINPATGDVLWEGTAAQPEEVKQAVTAAQEAFFDWRRKSVEERTAILKTYRAILEKQKKNLALTIAKETGKTRWDALSEVEAMIAKVAISITAYHKRTGRKEGESGGMRNVVHHRPHGVVAVLGPYNFPGHLPNGHIVPALLAGNCVVFKPSELTPLVGEEINSCWQAADLPQGVFNLVQGDGVTGAALVSQPQLKGVYFTGSSKIGRQLHKQFGGRPEVILALEMGGNNPLVVWNIKDIKAAVYYTILSAFISTGQRCTCARRLIISQNKKADAFLQLLLEASGRIRVGAYMDKPEPFMGPLVRMQQAHNVLSAQHQLQEAGGQSLLEMKLLQQKLPFVSPGIIDMTSARNRPDEEYFGPLLQVIRVPNFDRAIDVANQTAYGLASAIFTDDQKLYERFSDQVQAGLVNWNRQTTGASSAAPFGGIGISGNHHPSAYYASDYCVYPVASMEMEQLQMPQKIIPGLTI